MEKTFLENYIQHYTLPVKLGQEIKTNSSLLLKLLA